VRVQAGLPVPGAAGWGAGGNPYVPHLAEIVGKRREAQNIWTFRLRFLDEAVRRAYSFQPGQFNMVYVFGVGEVPISIVSDPQEPDVLDHTVRVVGRVTRVLGSLQVGDTVGLRGPYGTHWPLRRARGKDVVIVTGGLGCAPVVSVINYIFRRRERYGALKILHGVKTPRDLIYRKRFAAWRRHPDTEVLLSADQPDATWRYSVGVVTNLFDRLEVVPERTMVMICGPEVMMRFAARNLMGRGIPPERIYVSLERNMQCGVGHCGHCQMGPWFVCRDGPVFCYEDVAPFLEKEGI